jgi:hypothetical protein
MRMAFQIADSKIDDENFLAVFRACGCYLMDLSHEPVDHLDPPLRRAMRSHGEKFLAREIMRLQPGIIAPVLRSIAGNVENAAARANWQGQILQFPYPGRWSRYREAFIKALVPVIRCLRVEEASAFSPPDRVRKDDKIWQPKTYYSSSQPLNTCWCEARPTLRPET